MLQVVRRAIKPIMLWRNSCQVRDSERDVFLLEMWRQDALQKMRQENERQVTLRERRNEIAGW